MDTFDQILADAKRSRDEAEEFVRQVNAGASLAPGMSRERALEILNGCISDYNAVIKRLGRRDRA